MSEQSYNELLAEYERLWQAVIDFANTPGTMETDREQAAYRTLFKTAVASRFWNDDNPYASFTRPAAKGE